MAGFTASWAHGNAAVMETPRGGDDGGVFDFNHFGWGTQIVMRPGFSRWFHIALPSPVMLDGKRMKLIRVFLQLRIERLGTVQQVHLWDGQNRVAVETDFKQNPTAQMPGHRTFELLQPREWFFGAGLSFRLSGTGFANGNFVDNRDAPIFVIGSAGADFEVS